MSIPLSHFLDLWMPMEVESPVMSLKERLEQVSRHLEA